MSIPVAAAQAEALGVAARLATPAFPSTVSAAGGVIAWASASGSGHRFEIVVRSGGHNRALSATSAVGWIDGVKLGTSASGSAIVVYSRCPHSPFASGRVGSAGTDGCRLWWARLSGGAAHEIAAAPADTSIGAATKGVVAFAVQPNTAHENQPARVETAPLSGGSAHALRVPTPDGAAIDDISASAGQVAFSEAVAPSSSNVGISEIWLDEGATAPQLIAQISSDSNPIDDSEQYFDGVTLSSGFIYAFLYSQAGIVPPVASKLEQIALPGLATSAVSWAPSGSLRNDGINATAFDPSENRLVLDLFSPESEFSSASSTCSTSASSARACPVVQSGPVSFG
ncbi:MAG: hypothetical protein ABSG93_14770 [Solirubrobacteraceae bacterium]